MPEAGTISHLEGYHSQKNYPKMLPCLQLPFGVNSWCKRYGEHWNMKRSKIRNSTKDPRIFSAAEIKYPPVDSSILYNPILQINTVCSVPIFLFFYFFLPNTMSPKHPLYPGQLPAFHFDPLPMRTKPNHTVGLYSHIRPWPMTFLFEGRSYLGSIRLFLWNLCPR